MFPRLLLRDRAMSDASFFNRPWNNVVVRIIMTRVSSVHPPLMARVAPSLFHERGGLAAGNPLSVPKSFRISALFPEHAGRALDAWPEQKLFRADSARMRLTPCVKIALFVPWGHAGIVTPLAGWKLISGS